MVAPSRLHFDGAAAKTSALASDFNQTGSSVLISATTSEPSRPTWRLMVFPEAKQTSMQGAPRAGTGKASPNW